MTMFPALPEMPELAPECCSGYSKMETIFMRNNKWDTGSHVPARIMQRSPEFFFSLIHQNWGNRAFLYHF
jgi:hypothetical protein